MKKLFCALAALGLLATGQVHAAEDGEKEKINFADEVWPILQENCVRCHGADEQKGSLRFDKVTHLADLIHEGDVINAGEPENSQLFELVSLPADHDDRMPAEGDPLSDEQIQTIKQWIAQGASVGEIIFEEDVLPILKENCIQCHGPDKQKGELRLDSREAIMEGGDVGDTIIPGNGFDSGLFFRISLPPGDGDIMPPESAGDPLPSEQQELVQKWIDDGAFFGGWEKLEEGTEKDPLPEVAEADAEALSKLREVGALAMPLAQDTNTISVDFRSVAEKIDDSHLKLLEPIKEQLVWLNLANTNVTDRGVRTLADFPHLRRLHLENTDVGDDALDALTQIESLRYLNLYGTNVTDDGVKQLMGLEYSLHRVRTAASRNEQNLRRAARELNKLQDKLSDARSELSKLRDNGAEEEAIEKAQKKVDELASSVERARSERMASQVNVQLAKQELERVNSEIDQVQELEDLRQDLAQKVDSRQSAADEAQKKLVDAESTLSEAEQKLEELKKGVEEKSKAVDEAKKAVQEAEKAHKEAQKKVNNQQNKLNDAMGQAKKTAQSAVKQLDEGAPGKAAELAGKLQNQSKAAQKAKGKLAELKKTASEKKKALDEAKKKLSKAQEEHKKAKQAVSDQQEKIEKQKGKIKQAKAEKANAEEALEKAKSELDEIEGRIRDRRSGYIANLPNLKKLYLWQTKVSPKTADKLKRSRPTTTISAGEDSTPAEEDESEEEKKETASAGGVHGSPAAALGAASRPADDKADRSSPALAQGPAIAAPVRSGAEEGARPIAAPVRDSLSPASTLAERSTEGSVERSRVPRRSFSPARWLTGILPASDASESGSTPSPRYHGRGVS